MPGVGRRFDIEEVRREALAEKRAKRIRAIVSNVTFVVVLLVLVVGSKIGWDNWREKLEADRIAAEEARAEEERAIAERKKVDDARAKELSEKRAAERRAQEEARTAERKAREEKLAAERRAREEELRRKEEELRFAEESKAEQQELKKYEDRCVSELRFQIGDHLSYQYGLDDLVESSVDESRWMELSKIVQRGQTIELLEQLRCGSVTNYFSDNRYPDRDTFAKLLDNLNAETFTLVLRLKDEVRGRRLALVAPSEEKGLAEPEGSRPLKSGSRVIGWTVPFTYGDKSPLFLLEQATAVRFTREWASLRRKLSAEAAKLDNRDEYVARRLKRELPAFAKSVKIEVTTPPPDEKSNIQPTSSQKRDENRRPMLKGGNPDIRSMRGPRTLGPVAR